MAPGSRKVGDRMKPLLWIFAAVLALMLTALPWAIGVNVALHGQPAAWGSCK